MGKIDQLNIKYEKLCNEYVKLFCKKHDFDVDDTYWISAPGSILSVCEQYFFNLDNIIEDLTKNYPKDTILKWQEDTTDHHFYCQKHNLEEKYINLSSYGMGLRYEQLDKTPLNKVNLPELKIDLSDLKQKFEKMIDEYNLNLNQK